MLNRTASTRLLLRFCQISKAQVLGIGAGLGRPLAAADDFEAEVGNGVKCCIVDGRQIIHIGNSKGLETNGLAMKDI